MTGEPDAHEVIHLAFHEVRAFPNAGHGGDTGIILSHASLDTDPRAVWERQEMVDHLKPFVVLRIIRRAHVCDVIEGRSGVVVEKRHDVKDPIGSHAGGQLRARPVVLHGQDSVREFGLQRFKQGMHGSSVRESASRCVR